MNFRCVLVQSALLLAAGVASVSAVTVDSFSPPLGTTNDAVTILGTGFVSGSTTVRFGATNATSGTIDPTAFVATMQQINAHVPNGAVTGLIFVKVGSTSASNNAPFIVIAHEPYATNFS